MPGLLGAEDVVDVEDVIAVLVVVAIVLDPLARLGQNTARVARRLVFESGVADAIGGGEVHSERLEGLSSQVSIQVTSETIGVMQSTDADEAAFGVGSPEGWLSVDLGLEVCRRPYPPELGDGSLVLDGRGTLGRLGVHIGAVHRGQ